MSNIFCATVIVFCWSSTCIH